MTGGVALVALLAALAGMPSAGRVGGTTPAPKVAGTSHEEAMPDASPRGDDETTEAAAAPPVAAKFGQSATPDRFDLGLLGGTALRLRSTGDGADAAFGYGLLGGFEVALSGPLRARAELQVRSDTFGGGQDVEAVRLDSRGFAAFLLAGVDLRLLRVSDAPLGVELLAGPGLRLTRVEIEVTGTREIEQEVAPMLALAGGAHVDLSPWRLGVRLATEIPQRRLVCIEVAIRYCF